MDIVNKIKEYIKNNKLFVFVMAIGIIAFCIQIKFVVLYADDMSLGIIAKNGGLIDAFKHLAENYMNWGGGPTPLIAILFMKFDLKVWKLFSCIIMFFIVLMSVKIINYKSKINKGILAAIIWSFIYILNIWISRETIYWLDGHLAYVFTTFQLLLYIYYMYTKFIMKKEVKKYDYILLPIVAFFSGWTGPQTAALTVLFGISLILWRKIIDKEKLPRLLIISVVFSILGCLVEVLAPGNSVRMAESFPEFASYGIIEKILYRVDSVYGLIFKFNDYGLGSLAFFSFIAFGVIACISYRLANKEENKKLKNTIKSMSILIIAFIAFVLLTRLNLIDENFNKLLSFRNLLTETVTIKMLIPYIVASAVMLITCLLALYISIKRNNCTLVIIYISALIAQGIMVVSPYSPLRSTFFSIGLLWISITYLVQIAYEEKIEINYIIVLVLGIIQKELRNCSTYNLFHCSKFI